MKPRKKFEQLQVALSRLEPHPRKTQDVAPGTPVCAGQFWLTRYEPQFPAAARGMREELPVALVIIEAGVGDIDGHAVHWAVPVVGDPGMAGPSDVVLPRDLLGYRAMACFGVGLSILEDSLLECQGMLPEEWNKKLQECWNHFMAGDERPDVELGIGYLDDMDFRYRYQQDLVERVAYLRDPLVLWAEKCGVLVDADGALDAATGGEGCVIEFLSHLPAPIEFAAREVELAAAAGGEEACRVLYWPGSAEELERAAAAGSVAREGKVGLTAVIDGPVCLEPNEEPMAMQSRLRWPGDEAPACAIACLYDLDTRALLGYGAVAGDDIVVTIDTFFPAAIARSIRGGRELLLLVLGAK